MFIQTKWTHGNFNAQFVLNPYPIRADISIASMDTLGNPSFIGRCHIQVLAMLALLCSGVCFVLLLLALKSFVIILNIIRDVIRII